jgi:Catalase
MVGNGYLLYEASVEQIPPEEAQTVKAILDSIGRTNVTSSDKQGRGIRQQHAKGQGFLKGELTVYGDLPEHLRQGMFAAPRTYPIIVRLSTAFGDIRSDRIRVPRGMAIKVLGVEGPKALRDDTSANQDFLLVNHKTYFSNAAAYLRLQRRFEWQPLLPDFALRGAGLLARGVKGLCDGVGIATPMALQGIADPGCNILGETFHSEAAIRYGAHIARIRAVPVSEQLRKLTGAPAHADDDALLSSVVAFFRNDAAEYELRAQLGTDLRRTPVEDTSVDWPESVSVPQPIGRISLPRQDADSPQRRAYADDILSFNPWHCLVAHQPLGSIMRLRKEAYRVSSDFRHKQNRKDRIEPKDISEYPD